MRGGCKYINLRGIDLSSTSSSAVVTIPGIYDRIESCYGDKELILVGINTEGTHVFSASLPVVVDSDNFVFTCGLQSITVTADDGVYLY